MTEDIQNIKQQISTIMQEVLALDKLKAGDIFVLGCSTSEVVGGHIGKQSAPAVGMVIVETILQYLKPLHVFLAVQCCEHLNRSLVIEEACLHKYNLVQVNVVPTTKAGGSAAVAAMQLFDKPVMVENIQAHAGIDIGDTFIGMHLKNVVVPVRLSINTIGSAHLTVAYTRPKYIGGARASYV